jgi:hypothetical protein
LRGPLAARAYVLVDWVTEKNPFAGDIMSNLTETLAEYPAYRIIAPLSDRVFAAIDGAEVQVQIRGQWRGFTFGSVASSVLRYNEDPIAAYEKAVAKGEETHWLSQNATALVSHKVPQKTLVGLQLGDKVHFQGHDFILTPAPNGNITLNREAS